MGIDAKELRQVIHIGVPQTLEEYFQETGRDGEMATATLHYNGHIIKKTRQDVKDSIRGLCKYLYSRILVRTLWI